MFKRIFLFLCMAVPVLAQNPIHVTYLWHMHQPNYYPYNTVDDIDSWGLFNFNIRSQVFDPRMGPYGEWVKNAVQAAHDRNMPHAGVQVSMSGSLMENLDGLYGHGWRDHYRHARNNLRTAHNNPRLNLLAFSNHHSLMPLTSRESMIMQLRLHREVYQDVFGIQDGSYSKGLFPAESSFAMHMVPALVSQGIEWVLVDSGHIDRTLEDLPWSSASSIRPNRADQRNGTTADWNSEWVQLQNVWAPTPVAAPFSYQPHRIRYVDPNSDPNDPIIYEMLAVPAARYEGNENARGGYGAFKPENVWGSQVDKNNNPQRPMLMVAHSDGDNFGMLNADAYHGQHQAFLDMTLSNDDFAHTSIQDYLAEYPVPADSPYIHCEPGSWIGIDGGTPYFEKWVEDNARDGEHPDHWNWSMIQAAHNRVLHAESLEGEFSMNDVRWGIGSDTARAWRYYLNAETSCYLYWDFDRANPWDGNVTRAANMAIAEAQKVIDRHPGVDNVGPSIFQPQRRTWNPGGNHWGEGDNNLIQPSDFEVWTFVDDVSGVDSVELKWRTGDWNSYKDLNEFRHEIYAHTPGLNSPWNTVTMQGDWYPPVQGPLVPDPLSRAMRYSGMVAGATDTLVSYYVEATDSVGNVRRSEIFHVWVGEHTEGGGGVEPAVTFHPTAPQDCEAVTIRYQKANTLLGANPVHIHIGRNGWQDVIEPNPVMTDAGDYWEYVYTPTAGTENIQVVFNNGSGAWDNNGGQDWNLTIAGCGDEGGGGEVPPVLTVEIDPAAPTGCEPITIRYATNGRNLLTASQVYIHIGRNGWQDVIEPNPAMTYADDVWTYTYTPAPGTEIINFCFNDGGATWDNNTDANWNYAVTGCDAPPSGIQITSPAGPTNVAHEVAAYTLQGTIMDTAIDQLRWTNSLTGGAGSVPAAESWTIADIPLNVGDNQITVYGEVPGLPGAVAIAEDERANYSDWTDGLNLGSGFGPWSLSSNENAGHFLGAHGFGLWSNDGDNLAEAIRPFLAPLSDGQSFHVRMRNGFVWETGGSVGVALRDADETIVWQLYFNGGNYFYDGTDGMTDIGWTGDGLNISFTMTSPTTYSVVVHPDGSDPRTYTGDVAAPITSFRAWSYNNGELENNDGRDYYIDNLSIMEYADGGGETHSASVTITRAEAGEPDSNGDGVEDWWYTAHGFDPLIENLADQMGDNGLRLGESFRLNLDPRDSAHTFKFDALNFVSGDLHATWGAGEERSYQIEYTPTLFPPVWTNLPAVGPHHLESDPTEGTRNSETTPIEANGAFGFYRLRLVD
jgi:hypothetical protein